LQGQDKGLANSLPKLLQRFMPKGVLNPIDQEMLQKEAASLMLAFNNMKVADKGPIIAQFTPIDWSHT